MYVKIAWYCKFVDAELSFWSLWGLLMLTIIPLYTLQLSELLCLNADQQMTFNVIEFSLYRLYKAKDYQNMMMKITIILDNDFYIQLSHPDICKTCTCIVWSTYNFFL
jgi:hypothetical protein